MASAITPVPGGVGPMTIAMLLSNTLDSAKRAYNFSWVDSFMASIYNSPVVFHLLIIIFGAVDLLGQVSFQNSILQIRSN